RAHCVRPEVLFGRGDAPGDFQLRRLVRDDLRAFHGAPERLVVEDVPADDPDRVPDARQVFARAELEVVVDRHRRTTPDEVLDDGRPEDSGAAGDKAVPTANVHPSRVLPPDQPPLTTNAATPHWRAISPSDSRSPM